MKSPTSSERRKHASGILSRNGYGNMKDLATDAVHEHEAHMHKGDKKTKIKLSSGGEAKGKSPRHTLDRKPRAAGGRNKGHKEPRVAVNVINAGKQPVPVPMPGAGMGGPRPPAPMAAPPAPMGPPPGANPMAAHPPMGGPAPGMGMRPNGLHTGGRAKRAGGGPVRDKDGDMPHLEGGAGGGLGRLEKAKHEEKRRKPSAH